VATAAAPPRPRPDTTEPVVFVSKSEELALVRVPATAAIDKLGQKHPVPGYRYVWENGRLTLFPGQDRLHIWDDPATGEPIYQDAIEWLREHHLYNVRDGGGFWEVPPTAPPSRPVLDAILATAIRNIDAKEKVSRIRGAYLEEIKTWKRADVLEQAKSALELLGFDTSTLPEPEATPERISAFESDAKIAASLAATDDEFAEGEIDTSRRPHTLEEKGIELQGGDRAFGA
jgi:hypothetical protein